MNKDINAIISYIAKQEGVTEQEAIDEMQSAIDEGYNNPDPAVRAYWAAMPFFDRPTPQKLILYLLEKIENEKQQ